MSMILNRLNSGPILDQGRVQGQGRIQGQILGQGHLQGQVQGHGRGQDQCLCVWLHVPLALAPFTGGAGTVYRINSLIYTGP